MLVDNLARILSLQRPDGDFPTWAENMGYISTEEAADCMVQINILQYLALRGKVPPKTCANVLAHRLHKDFPACGLYYSDPVFYDLLYLRAARTPGLECLAAGLASMSSPATGEWAPAPDLPSQDLIFGLLNRIYLGHCGTAETLAAKQLIASQRPDGSWQDKLLYLDGRQAYFQSDTVTTAYALRALWNLNAQCGQKAP